MKKDLPRPVVIKKLYNAFSNPNKDKLWVQIPLQDARYLHIMEWMYGHDVKFDSGCLFILESSEAFKMLMSSSSMAHWKLDFNENLTRSADKIEEFDCYYIGAENEN